MKKDEYVKNNKRFTNSGIKGLSSKRRDGRKISSRDIKKHKTIISHRKVAALLDFGEIY